MQKKYLLLLVTLIIGQNTPVYAEALNSESQETTFRNHKQRKEWNILVYIAGDNNLHYFLWNNIRQMARVGSNGRINIIVQINEPGSHKKTQRYYIEQNKAYLLNKAEVEQGIKLDSGHPQTLSDFVVESIAKYPAERNFLILANHGSGILDPITSCIVNPADLLSQGSEREYAISSQHYTRGICFDNSHGSYLTNEGLETALQTICKKLGKKIDILGLDACFMGMLECGNLIKKYADIMIASQEVELGLGWYYDKMLIPFTERNLSPQELAHHVINCYNHYQFINDAYTLSAINLSQIDKVESALDNVARILHKAFVSGHTGLRTIVRQARDRRNCTCFEEVTFIDLGHWYRNLHQYLLADNTPKDELYGQLRHTLEVGLESLQAVVISKAQGKSLAQASGLSIYFPERSIHESYYRTPFARTNHWPAFLGLYTHYAKTLLMQPIE